jgi:hypothetical protein
MRDPAIFRLLTPLLPNCCSGGHCLVAPAQPLFLAALQH